jgi:hypothetical protein
MIRGKNDSPRGLPGFDMGRPGADATVLAKISFCGNATVCGEFATQNFKRSDKGEAPWPLGPAFTPFFRPETEAVKKNHI